MSAYDRQSVLRHGRTQSLQDSGTRDVGQKGRHVRERDEIDVSVHGHAVENVCLHYPHLALLLCLTGTLENLRIALQREALGIAQLTEKQHLQEETLAHDLRSEQGMENL